MSEIKSVYILDATGKLMYSCENNTQGSSDFDIALLSGISNIVKSFSFDFEKRPIEIIEISYNNLVITRDEKSNHILVLKYRRESKEKKIFKDLEKIQKQYQNSFKQNSLHRFGKFINKFLRIDESQANLIHNFSI